MMKEYKVDVIVTFKKTYILAARDSEYAEDAACDEACYDSYDAMNPDEVMDIDVYDIERV